MHEETYRLIPLRNRVGDVVANAIVDEDDYDWAMQWRWHRNTWGYVARGTRCYAHYCPTCGVGSGERRRRQFLLHRELLGLALRDGLEADHINGDRLDNRRANLRALTRQQNAQNVRPAGRTSSHRGVSIHRPSGLFQAVAHIDGHTHHLGYFRDERDAAYVASDFRREHMPFSSEDAT